MLVIVGGGPAGHAAAEAFREHGGREAVTVLLAEGRLPYQRPPLSKELLRGESEEHELPLADDAWYAERDIELRHATATALDPAARTITLRDGGTLPFSTCILATGAEPTRPPLDGLDLPGVFVLREAGHALELRAAARAAQTALIVGSGFIGCEAAASLRAHGIDVTLVSQEAAPQLERLGPEVAARLAGWLEADGVTLRGDTELEGVERDAGRLRAAIADGPPVTADLVLLASGVAPRAALAQEAGLELGPGGEIAVDEQMRTAARAVLACGDCAIAHNAAAGRPLHVEHWGDALGQGAVAGAVAAGAGGRWEEVPGFWSTIGARTLKYAAWGDGFDSVRIDERGAGFTAWYERDGRCVGVLAHERDDDYDRGRELIARGEPAP